MSSIYRRFFSQVSATTTDTDTYTPANGQTILVKACGGEAGSSPDTTCVIVWDEGGGEEKVIYATHNSSRDDSLTEEFTGDGSKTLKIKLINDQTTSDYLGAWWRAF